MMMMGYEGKDGFIFWTMPGFFWVECIYICMYVCMCVCMCVCSYIAVIFVYTVKYEI